MDSTHILLYYFILWKKSIAISICNILKSFCCLLFFLLFLFPPLISNLCLQTQTRGGIFHSRKDTKKKKKKKLSNPPPLAKKIQSIFYFRFAKTPTKKSLLPSHTNTKSLRPRKLIYVNNPPVNPWLFPTFPRSPLFTFH